MSGRGETFDDFLKITMPVCPAQHRWGEDLGAPKTSFFPTFLRAGFEPLRGHATPKDSSRPKSYCPNPFPFSSLRQSKNGTMALTTVSYPLFATIALLSVSTSLLAQDDTQISGKVLTPFGYGDSANVQQIPQGYDLIQMPDGHMRMQNRVTGAPLDFADSAAEARVPFTDSGWITYASWLNQTGTPVSHFTTTWTVPRPPSYYHRQTLFQFNSIEPSSFNSILQPVLQYGTSAAGGGKYWSVASWYVTGSNAYYSSLVKVSSGKNLTGVIALTGNAGGKFTYSCDFTGISGTNFSIQNIAELTWCTETLEVYSVTACTEFPKTAYSRMSGINLLTGSTTPSVSWAPTDVQTNCCVQTTIVTNGGSRSIVDIYY